MNEHLKSLLDAADAAERGETIDVTDETPEEYIARLMKQAPIETAGETSAIPTKNFFSWEVEDDAVMSPEISATEHLMSTKENALDIATGVEQYTREEMEEFELIDEMEVISEGLLKDMPEEMYNLFLRHHRTEPSREQRLQEFLEEFEAARLANPRCRPPYLETPDGFLESVSYAISGEEKETIEQLLDQFAEVLRPARRYIIARDFNVWEDGKWQMVWKLQHP